MRAAVSKAGWGPWATRAAKAGASSGRRRQSLWMTGLGVWGVLVGRVCVCVGGGVYICINNIHRDTKEGHHTIRHKKAYPPIAVGKAGDGVELEHAPQPREQQGVVAPLVDVRRGEGGEFRFFLFFFVGHHYHTAQPPLLLLPPPPPS